MTTAAGRLGREGAVGPGTRRDTGVDRVVDTREQGSAGALGRGRVRGRGYTDQGTAKRTFNVGGRGPDEHHSC